MSVPNWSIRAETPADDQAIAALNEAGFGPGRFAKSAFRLREGVAPVRELGFVAASAEGLHGSVRFWPINVGGQAALLLGPLAVDARLRGHDNGWVRCAEALRSCHPGQAQREPGPMRPHSRT